MWLLGCSGTFATGTAAGGDNTGTLYLRNCKKLGYAGEGTLTTW